MIRFRQDTSETVESYFGTSYKSALSITFSEKFQNERNKIIEKYDQIDAATNRDSFSKNLQHFNNNTLELKRLQLFYSKNGLKVPKNGFSNRLEYAKWQQLISTKGINHTADIRTLLDTFKTRKNNHTIIEDGIIREVIEPAIFLCTLPDSHLFDVLCVPTEDSFSIQFFPWTSRENLMLNIKSILELVEEKNYMLKASEEPYILHTYENRCLVELTTNTTSSKLIKAHSKIQKAFSKTYKKYYSYFEKKRRKPEEEIAQIKIFIEYEALRRKGLRGQELFKKLDDFISKNQDISHIVIDTVVYKKKAYKLRQELNHIKF